MLAKVFRLTGKDINYLTRRRQFINAGLFNVFYVKQYPNRKFNQISVNIPLKFDKRAVQRRIVKRAVLQIIEKGEWKEQRIKGEFYKIFIFLNKKKAPELAQKFASMDKKDKINYIQNIFNYSWKQIISKIR
ncbi:MAG: hypothetical protein GXP45_00185 [bacterium]|nr:hypothetical protein [bacterium]